MRWTGRCGERIERCQWQKKRDERVATVKISSVRRKAARKFWAPQQDHRPLRNWVVGADDPVRPWGPPWGALDGGTHGGNLLWRPAAHGRQAAFSKSLAEFASADAKSSNYFSPRHVRGEKFLSVCKCGISALCAEIMRAADCNLFGRKFRRNFRQLISHRRSSRR